MISVLVQDMAKEVGLKDVMLNASMVMLAILIGSKVLGYAFHLVFVRLFTPEEYGVFILAWSMGLFVCGMMPNLSNSMLRYVAYYRGRGDRKDVDATIRTGIVLLLVFTTLYSAASIVGYAVGFTGLDFTSFLFMLSTLVLGAVFTFGTGIISGYRRPEMSTFFNFVQNLLRVAAVGAAALVVASLHGVMVLVFISYLIVTLAVAVYAYRNFGTGSSYDWGIARKILTFGTYNIVHTTANNILSWSGIFFIQYFLGPAMVAVYNVASLASTVCLVFFTSVLQIFAPVTSEMFGAKRYDRISHLTSYLFESFFLLFLPIFLAIVVFSHQILTLFFTKDYVAGVAPLQVLSIGVFFFGLAMLFVELTNAEGRPEINARNIGFGAVLNATLTWLFVPSYGMLGAGYATLVSSAVILWLSYSHVRGVVALSYSKMRVGKVVACSVAAVAAAQLVKTMFSNSLVSLALSSLALVSVYSSTLVLSKSLRSEDASLAVMFLEKLRAPKGLTLVVSWLLSFGVAISS